MQYEGGKSGKNITEGILGIHKGSANDRSSGAENALGFFVQELFDNAKKAAGNAAASMLGAKPRDNDSTPGPLPSVHGKDSSKPNDHMV